MLRSLVLSELASEADLGKFLRPTQMAHRRRSIPNIGAASAVSRVGPTHRGRCDRRAQRSPGTPSSPVFLECKAGNRRGRLNW